MFTINVYSQNPTAVEEVTLYALESLSVVPAKSQGLYVSEGKCIVTLYRAMPRPPQLTSNELYVFHPEVTFSPYITSNDFTRRYLANRL